MSADNDDAEKAVELVLTDGVDINIPAKSNRTPLLWASPPSSSQFFKTLVDLGADVNVQRTDDKGSSLVLAAYWNNYMATCILLQQTFKMRQDAHHCMTVHVREISAFRSYLLSQDARTTKTKRHSILQSRKNMNAWSNFCLKTMLMSTCDTSRISQQRDFTLFAGKTKENQPGIMSWWRNLYWVYF